MHLILYTSAFVCYLEVVLSARFEPRVRRSSCSLNGGDPEVLDQTKVMHNCITFVWFWYGLTTVTEYLTESGLFLYLLCGTIRNKKL